MYLGVYDTLSWGRRENGCWLLADQTFVLRMFYKHWTDQSASLTIRIVVCICLQMVNVCHFHFGKVLSKMQWGRKPPWAKKERVSKNPQWESLPFSLTMCLCACLYVFETISNSHTSHIFATQLKGNANVEENEFDIYLCIWWGFCVQLMIHEQNNENPLKCINS